MKKGGPFLMSLFGCFILVLFSINTVLATNQGTANLSTDVQPYISLSVTAGSSVGFGNLTPGTPIAAPATGTIVAVTTSAANGYTLGIYDGSDTNSAMLHTDTTTYIADYAGTITTPTSWTGTGVGVTLFAADTNKEAKWGTGTTYSDSNNKYAGIPATTATVHTVTGYHASADTSSWAFKVDVPNSQKTGSYSGDVTFSATASL